MTYVPVTVGRRPAGFTVARGPGVAFTVTGHPGGTTDHLLLTEDGHPLLLESGELILTA